MLSNTSSNQFFTKISELILYLIQIIDGNEKNLVEISGPGQTKLTYLQFESTVILHSSAVERLVQNRFFERSEFKDVLENIYSITAELVYPPDSFKDTYNMIPSSFVSSLKLSVYNFWHWNNRSDILQWQFHLMRQIWLIYEEDCKRWLQRIIHEMF